MITITPNIIVGSLIVIINLIPMLTKQYKYLPLSAILSLVLALILKFLG